MLPRGSPPPVQVRMGPLRYCRHRLPPVDRLRFMADDSIIADEIINQVG